MTLAPVVDSFSQILVDSAARATLLLVLACVATSLMRRSSAALRHRVWSLTMSGLLLLPALSWLLPVWQLPMLSGNERGARPPQAIAQHQVMPGLTTPIVETAPAESNIRLAAPVAQPIPAPNASSVVPVEATPELSAAIPSWPVAVMIVWSFGAGLCFLGLMFGLWQARRLSSGSQSLGEEPWPQLVDHLRQRLGLVRRVELREFAQPIVPLTWGLFRPMVVLPQQARAWAVEMRRAVLLHELAHVQRGDVAHQLLGRVACALYWYHPLAWFGLRQLRQEREHACDDAVVQSGERASDYAEQLLEVARLYHRPGGLSLAVEMTRGGSLEQRLRVLFDAARSHQPLSWKMAWSLLAVASLFLGTAAVIQPVPTSTAAEDTKAITTQRDTKLRTDRLGDSLPEKALIRFGTRRFQHADGPTQIILSSDEQTVVSMMRSTLSGWDVRSGKELWQQPIDGQNNGIIVGAAGYGIRPLAKIPDSNLIAFADEGGVSVVDPRTGKTKPIVTDLTVTAKAVDVSPDGSLFAVGGAKALLVVNGDGDTVYAIENQPDDPLDDDINDADRLKFGGDFSYARFSPDGQYLALVNSENPKSIQLLDAAAGNMIREIQGNARIVRIEFSPDSQQIVATERDIATRLYDVSTGERLWELLLPQAGRSESYTSCVAFRPDGKQIAVGAPLGSDHRIRLIDPMTGNETGSLSGSGWKPWTMEYLRDSSTLYGSGWDGMIRRWDLSTNEQLPHPGGVRATGICAMSRDEHLMAFADDRHDIHLVRLPSGETVSRLRRPNTEWDQIVFSYDGTQIAAGGRTLEEIHVVIWDVATRNVQHEWSWPKGDDSHAGVEALAWSRNGFRVAAASFRQDTAYVWDLSTGRQKASVKHNEVYGMDISSDGRTLITAGWDKHLRIWDCDTEAMIQEAEVTSGGDHNDTRMYGVKLSNDETLIATVDMTNSIRLFRRNLEPLNVIENTGSFSSGALQFSRSDLWIGVGTHSQARVYDVHSRELLWEANDHQQYVYTVDFGADDRTLLSGGTDGVCYLWALEVERGDDSNDPESLYKQLVGPDAQLAFQAFLRLSSQPESAVALLRDQLTSVGLTDIPEAEFRKAFLTLGARNPTLREQAQRRFHEWGLSGYERLMKEANSSQLGEIKQTFTDSFGKALSTRYTRATRLLMNIDSAAAREAMSAVQANAPSTLIRDVFRTATLSNP